MLRSPREPSNAVWDTDEQRLISDAEVAEIEFTAFTSRSQRQHVTARLIVRRVKRLNPAGVAAGQDALFAAYRHHAVFTDNPMPLLDAETCHRQHAIVEQVIADLKSGPMAHLPSAKFNANAAWLVLAAIAINLTRAGGWLASTFHARATAATIRRHLINVPARLARSARQLTLHLPTDWALGRGLATTVRRVARTSASCLRPPSPPTRPDPSTPWKCRTDRQPRHTPQKTPT